MKAEINENKKGFEPIEVKITIESMDELVTLVSRFNMNSLDAFEKRISKTDISYERFKDTSNLFWDNLADELYNIFKQRNNG